MNNVFVFYVQNTLNLQNIVLHNTYYKWIFITPLDLMILSWEFVFPAIDLNFSENECHFFANLHKHTLDKLELIKKLCIAKNTAFLKGVVAKNEMEHKLTVKNCRF